MKRKHPTEARKFTIEEWERERLRQHERKEEIEERKRQAAMTRWAARFRKMQPVRALEKDDKTLIHEHWIEKYG